MGSTQPMRAAQLQKYFFDNSIVYHKCIQIELNRWIKRYFYILISFSFHMEFNYNLFWGFLLKGCEIIGKVSWNVNKNLASSCVRFKQILKSYFGHISNYGFVWCYFTTNISRSCVLTVVMCELEKEDFWNQMTFLLSWAHFRSSCAVIYNFLYKVYIGQLYFSNILGRNFDRSFYDI